MHIDKSRWVRDQGVEDRPEKNSDADDDEAGEPEMDGIGCDGNGRWSCRSLKGQVVRPLQAQAVPLGFRVGKLASEFNFKSRVISGPWPGEPLQKRDQSGH